MGSRLVTAVCVTAMCAGLGVPTARAATAQLLINFDHGETLAAGTTVTDSSGFANDGTVITNFGGALSPVNGVAVFPGRCRSEPCPNAIIRIPNSAGLNPGSQPFEWGAHIKLNADQTADGENVIQKGLYETSGGQWKLQVDKLPGHPSCILSGIYNGSRSRVTVKSPVSIADGAWHQVTCRRSAAGVSISIDGTTTASQPMRMVNVSNSAPVTIGGKNVNTRDNDQFQGQLDNLFMTLV